MNFEGIVQIAQEDSTTGVNNVLSNDWELLAVNTLEEGLVYTVGRRSTLNWPNDSGHLLRAI